MPMPIPMLIFTLALIVVVIFAVLTCSFVAVVVLNGLDVEEVWRRRDRRRRVIEIFR